MGKHIVTLLCVGSACACLAGAQTSSTVTASDRMFMTKAAQGGMAEVQLGQLAQQKASSQAVKDFGERMVTDHGKANDKLKSIASSKGVTLPSSVDAKDKALYDRLSALSGATFDKSYMQAMVKDHRTDVAEFQKESSKAHDSEIKSFASMSLPTLEDHLHMAEQVAAQVMKGGGATAQR